MKQELDEIEMPIWKLNLEKFYMKVLLIFHLQLTKTFLSAVIFIIVDS